MFKARVLWGGCRFAFFEKRKQICMRLFLLISFLSFWLKSSKTNSLRSPLCNVCSGPHCQSGALQTNKRVTYSQKNCHFFDLSIIRPIIKEPPFKEAFFVLKCWLLILGVDFLCLLLCYESKFIYRWTDEKNMEN